MIKTDKIDSEFEKAEKIESISKHKPYDPDEYKDKKKGEEQHYVLWLYKFLRPGTYVLIGLAVFIFFVVLPISSMESRHASRWAWIVDYMQGLTTVGIAIVTVIITNGLSALAKKVKQSKEESD